MTTATEFQAKVDKAGVNMDRLDAIVNGGPTVEVATDGGMVPSIAKVLGDLGDAGAAVEATAADRVQTGLDRVAAEVSRLGAEQSAAIAEGFVGPTYASTSAGIAATTNGQSFAVVDSGIVTIYKNVSGTSVYQRDAATVAALASTAPGRGAAMVGVKQNGTGAVDITVDVELRNFFRPYQYGAVGSGDETTQINNTLAAASGRDVEVTGQYVVGSVSNPLGSRLTGRGRLLVSAAQGGYFQNPQQTYTDVPRSSFNKAALYRIFARIRADRTTPLKLDIYGDSTVATAANGGGYASGAGEPHTLMARMLSVKGVRNPVQITNRAVGGTKWSDLDVIPNIDTVGGTSDGAIIKYCINEARTETNQATMNADLATMAATIDSKLAAIRASSGYANAANYTIILVGPTNTTDPQHGRTNLWYERCRAVLIAAAIKHTCFFYDPYLLMPGDVRWLAGLPGGMDDPFSNGQPIHPSEIIQSMWVAGLVDEMIGFSDLSIWDDHDRRPPTLQNSWTDYAGFMPAAYWLDRNGIVHVHGMIAPGTLAAGTTLFTLPVGFRPVAHQLFSVAVSGGAQANVRVLSTGECQLVDTLSGITYLSLEGVRVVTR